MWKHCEITSMSKLSSLHLTRAEHVAAVRLPVAPLGAGVVGRVHDVGDQVNSLPHLNVMFPPFVGSNAN